MQHCDINVTPGSWPTGPPAPATTQTINEEWNAEQLGIQLRYTPRQALRFTLYYVRYAHSASRRRSSVCSFATHLAPLRSAQRSFAALTDESKIHPCCHLPVAAALLSLLCTAKQASLSNQLRWSLRSAPRRSAPRARGVPRVSAQTLQTDPPPSLLARSSSRFVFRVWFRHKHGIKPKWE